MPSPSGHEDGGGREGGERCGSGRRRVRSWRTSNGRSELVLGLTKMEGPKTKGKHHPYWLFSSRDSFRFPLLNWYFFCSSSNGSLRSRRLAVSFTGDDFLFNAMNVFIDVFGGLPTKHALTGSLDGTLAINIFSTMYISAWVIVVCTNVCVKRVKSFHCLREY